MPIPSVTYKDESVKLAPPEEEQQAVNDVTDDTATPVPPWLEVETEPDGAGNTTYILTIRHLIVNNSNRDIYVSLKNKKGLTSCISNIPEDEPISSGEERILRLTAKPSGSSGSNWSVDVKLDDHVIARKWKVKGTLP
jgi:hypothetical protein